MTTPIKPNSSQPEMPPRHAKVTPTDPIAKIGSNLVKKSGVERLPSFTAKLNPSSSSSGNSVVAMSSTQNLIPESTRLSDDEIMSVLWQENVNEGFFWEVSDQEDRLTLNIVRHDNATFPPDKAYKFKEIEFVISKDRVIHHKGHEFLDITALEEHLKQNPGSLKKLPPKLPLSITEKLVRAPVKANASRRTLNRAEMPRTLKKLLKRIPFDEFCNHYESKWKVEDYLSIAKGRGSNFHNKFIQFLLQDNRFKAIRKEDRSLLIETLKKLPSKILRALLREPKHSSSSDVYNPPFLFIFHNIEFLYKKHKRYLIQNLKAHSHEIFQKHPQLGTVKPMILFKLLYSLENKDDIEAQFLQFLESPEYKSNCLWGGMDDSFLRALHDSDFYRKSSSGFRKSVDKIILEDIKNPMALFQLELSLKNRINLGDEYYNNILNHWQDDEILFRLISLYPRLAKLYAKKVNEGVLGDPRIIRHNLKLRRIDLVPILGKYGLKFTASDFLSLTGTVYPVLINKTMFTFFKKQFPKEYIKICLMNFIPANYFIELFEAGEIKPEDIPPNFLVSYITSLRARRIPINERALTPLIELFYAHQLPLEVHDKTPPLLIIHALQTARVDLANTFYRQTTRHPFPKDLLEACTTVKALSSLIQTQFVNKKNLSDYLIDNIKIGNYEVIPLFADPQIRTLMARLKNFDPEPLLANALIDYPLLDVARQLYPDDDFVFGLFAPHLENDSIKSRLAEMFVLNPVLAIEETITQVVAPRIPPKLLAVIKEEIAMFKEIGSLVARSRRFDFFDAIVDVYHSKNGVSPGASSSKDKPESEFTTFAKAQVAYGKLLRSLINSASSSATLFDLYAHFLKKTDHSPFLTLENQSVATRIIERYTPFLDDFENTRRLPPSHDIVKSTDQGFNSFMLDTDTLTFFAFSPLLPDEPIPLSCIMSVGNSYQFQQTTLANCKKYLPHHFANFESLKKPFDIRSEAEFDALIDSIAAFVWHNSHLCIVLRGNAQITMNIMNLLFNIHGIDVGPTRVDVTFIDCKALSIPLGEFIKEFRSYFEWGPRFSRGV